MFRSGKFLFLLIFCVPSVAAQTPDAAFYLKQGGELYMSGDYSGAVKAFDEAVALDSSNARTFNNRAAAKNKLFQFKGAIADAERALELKPDYWAAHDTKGFALLRMGEARRAIEEFDKAISANPVAAESYFNRGEAKTELKDYQGAVKDYTEAISLTPDFQRRLPTERSCGAIWNSKTGKVEHVASGCF